MLFVKAVLAALAAANVLGQLGEFFFRQLVHVVVAGLRKWDQLDHRVSVLAASAGLLDVFPSPSASRKIVSRYATCGRPTLACTPNSRIMRSTMISRCSSPMPAIKVWL